MLAHFATLKFHQLFYVHTLVIFFCLKFGGDISNGLSCLEKSCSCENTTLSFGHQLPMFY
jgi:hypothetical protein